MVKYAVLFEVRAEFLNVILTGAPQDCERATSCLSLEHAVCAATHFTDCPRGKQPTTNSPRLEMWRTPSRKQWDTAGCLKECINKPFGQRNPHCIAHVRQNTMDTVNWQGTERFENKWFKQNQKHVSSFNVTWIRIRKCLKFNFNSKLQFKGAVHYHYTTQTDRQNMG
jgi:hypothetical protein